jgi:hypothetical protein
VERVKGEVGLGGRSIELNVYGNVDWKATG